MRRARVVGALAVVAAVTTLPVAQAAPRSRTAAARPLHVSGNRLVDDTGRTVQPRGVNRSTPETRCLGLGVTSYFLGPTDVASVRAIASWGANVVRVPVNEDCWLGRNGLPAGGTAAGYRSQVAAYVRLLVAGGLNVVVDVHFAETVVLGVASPSYGAAPMLDRAHGAELWRSIATTFRDDTAVLFDLYNEPHDVTWACWRDGCDGYAGMAELVTAVRSAGATQPLVLTGPSWGNEISRWLAYRPSDPRDNLVAGVHVYPANGCATTTCLDARVAPVAAVAPVVVGETGDATGAYLETLPAWADAHGVGYLAFTWNVPASAEVGYQLVTSYAGTPTLAGAVYRSHLLSRVTVRTATTAWQRGYLVPFRR